MIRWISVGLMLCMTVGCSSKHCDVSGKVLLDDTPLAGGAINFYSDDGEPLGGAIEQDGSFRFSIPAGEYRVAVRASSSLPDGWKEGDPVPQQPSVPASYTRASDSGLTLSVDEDEQQKDIKFELKS